MPKDKKIITNGSYTGPERRQYCAQHCSVASTARNSVPRWAFLSSLSTMIVIALTFAGWHVSSLKKLEIDVENKIVDYETHMTARLADAQLRYSEDVSRFIRAVGDNRKMLGDLNQAVGEVKVRLGRAEAKQDLVLEKIKLTE